MVKDLIFSANVIVPIFLLIILGYVLTRIKLWDAHFLKIANDVCFKCLLPVLLFYNVATANIFEVFNADIIRASRLRQAGNGNSCSSFRNSQCRFKLCYGKKLQR